MTAKRKRARWPPMLVAMAAITVLTALTAIGAVAVAVKWVRLTLAVDEAAAASIGQSPTVTSILATRDAIRQTAKDHGAPRAVVFAAIERRTTAAGQPSHVACFYLCARFCHPDFERPLPLLLTATELDALRRERIREHTGPGRPWTHHHH